MKRPSRPTITGAMNIRARSRKMMMLVARLVAVACGQFSLDCVADEAGARAERNVWSGLLEMSRHWRIAEKRMIWQPA